MSNFSIIIFKIATLLKKVQKILYFITKVVRYCLQQYFVLQLQL